MSGSLKHPASRAILIVGVVVAAGLYSLAIRELVLTRGRAIALGWTIGPGPGGPVVTDVEAHGPASGRLQVGDRIVAVNGFPLVGRGLGLVAFMDLADGDRYIVAVERSSGPVEVSIEMRRRTETGRLWLAQVPLLLVSLSFFATGLWAASLRPGDAVARRYALVAVLASIVLLPFGVFAGEFSRGVMRGVLAWARVGAPVMLAAAYGFFRTFPPGITEGRVWRWLGLTLAAWSALLLPGAIATALALSGSATSAMQTITTYGGWLARNDLLSTLFIVASFTAVTGVIVRNHRAAAQADQRRRLRWVMWGLLAGTVPMLLAFVMIATIEIALGRVVGLPAWLRWQRTAAMFLIFVPVTFAYAVVRHRVIGIDVVIRASVQYLLAKNVLRIALVAPVLALIARTAANPGHTIGELLFDRPAYLVLAALSAVLLATRRPLSLWLDRRFFRDAAQRDRILLEAIGSIGAALNPDDAIRMATDGVGRALHPRSMTFYAASSAGGLLAAPANPSETWTAVAAPPALVRRLQQTGDPLDWEQQGEVRLVVPVGGGARRYQGVFVLGEKKSDEPYTAEERRLLKSLTDQIAIARDNAALRSEVAAADQQRINVLARVDASVNLLRECPACGRCFDRSQERCEDDDTPLAHIIGVERTIEGRYRLDRLIGRGGMGVVYAAIDERLGRRVAVKLLKNLAGEAAGTRQRFEVEAQALARVGHPNIVAIHDFGTIGFEMAFLVMEFLRGSTLRREMGRRGAVPPPDVAVWLAPVLDAMSFAHTAGVIHRDLKPENIFLADDHGRVTPKVLDFGVAKLSGPDISTLALTEPGRVVGTLAYMAPEQLEGRAIDSRADVFALGVCVIEAVTGFNPFRESDPAATIAAVLQRPAHVAGDGETAGALDHALQRCLAKRAEDRYPNIESMRAALVPALVACRATVNAQA